MIGSHSHSKWVLYVSCSLILARTYTGWRFPVRVSSMAPCMPAWLSRRQVIDMSMWCCCCTVKSVLKPPSTLPSPPLYLLLPGPPRRSVEYNNSYVYHALAAYMDR
jgi:hypothetical protein